MIRINLLGLPKPKKGKRAAAGGGGGGGESNIIVIAVVVLGLTAGANWWWYHQLQTDSQTLQKKIADAERENRRLADIKDKVGKLRTQQAELQRRADVIRKLQDNRSGPSELLTMIGDTVNKTDAVWLNSMKDDGNSVALDGTALSVNAVANLMENLKATGKFKSVEISETYQDDAVKQMQAFQFTLTCEKAAAAPAQAKKS